MGIHLVQHPFRHRPQRAAVFTGKGSGRHRRQAGEQVCRPWSRGVDDHAATHGEGFVGEPILHPNARHAAVLLEEPGGLQIVHGAGARIHRGQQERQRDAIGADHLVVVPDGPAGHAFWRDDGIEPQRFLA